MTRAGLRVVLGAWLLWLPLAAADPLHHALEMRIDPGRGDIEVEDTIRLDTASAADPVFALHPQLEPELAGAGRLIELPAAAAADVGAGVLVPRRYRVELAPGERQFTLRYRGRIRHALRQQGEEYARGFRETHGMIDPQGVFLSGASYWYPRFGDGLLRFELQVQLPAGWSAMTQGDLLDTGSTAEGVQEHWRCRAPQEEIYLIAGRFTGYRQELDDSGVEAQVLLRAADPALAERYLEATATYIDLYSRLIGPYPYRKFALVENFWETGYGMPSFTLLGPRVIRLPFILHSSYPHEILHNWWGNGVYVDYETGNWAEGLTSYLADHLIKEQRGQGAEYRRSVLQKYADYVRGEQDFALTAFRSRHSASSEAVGYGKTLMLFHMLRRRLGDAAFTAGLRALYRQYRFRVADFAAVRDVFSTSAQQPLEAFFTQWVERPGAPALRVSEPSVQAHGAGYVVRALLEQTQQGPAYALRVPLAVQLEGQAQAWQTQVSMTGKGLRLELEVPARPLVLRVDPEFDVFRRLQRAELPPALSQALGAQQVLIVLPSGAPAPLRAAYRALAESWQTGSPGRVEIASDAELGKLPADRAVWLFGWRNRFRPLLAAALDAYAFAETADGVQVAGTPLRRDRHTVVLMARQPDPPGQALGWLAAEQPDALPGLGRKLPHYGRYSYLGFRGVQPENLLKGQWPVVDSPLTLRLAPEPAGQAPLRLAPRQPLAAPAGHFSRERLRRDAAALAAETMAGRGLGSVEIDRAADYIAARFRDAGLLPGGEQDGSYFQVWRARVAALDDTVTLKNVIGILPGSDPRLADESLVIGAHYDHFGRGAYADHAAERGRIHPGADDNASGVAVLLELARALGDRPQPRTLVFVAFTAEETGRLGSRHFVENPGAYPPDRKQAMLNLDSVGRLGDRPVTVFGSGTAEEWPTVLRDAGQATGVAVQAVAGDFGSSDQSSFIEAGVPALQLFGGVHADLHRPGDTLDKLDLEGMRRVAALLHEVVVELAVRPEPLRSTLPEGGKDGGAAPAGKRRVSLGTVPDFRFAGTGVRIEAVREDTPAARAGLQAGDVIIAVNGSPVADLRDYAAALRRLEPGDEIRVRVRREGQERIYNTRVTQR